jgi:aerobic-type carbon monoxide dehydrogenase small subunit (CoxS/CutS family)
MLHPLPRTFVEHDPLQCGYRIPSEIFIAQDLHQLACRSNNARQDLSRGLRAIFLVQFDLPSVVRSHVSNQH